MKGKRGRPLLNENYAFDKEEYLRIIFLIHKCETYTRNPKFIHLKYALVEKSDISQEKITEVQDFFHIDSKDSMPYEYENLHYFTYVSGDGHECRYPPDHPDIPNDYRQYDKNIISQSVEFIKTFKTFEYTNEFKQGKLSFDELIEKLNRLTADNLIKKPFETKYDLHKYMTNLRNIDLIETNGLRRNASYALTDKCRRQLTIMHQNNLKFIIYQKLIYAPGKFIENNYDKFIDLFNTLPGIIY